MTAEVVSVDAPGGAEPIGAPHGGAEALGEVYRRHLGSGRAALGEILGGAVEVSSAGAWVTASDGRRYLDFGGYGVFILGHRHPAVVAAVHRQLDTHPLATRILLEPVVAGAAQTLAGVCPPGLEFVHFVNSGAEATEAALKLARFHGKTALVSARLGFHGKTLGALSLTANPLYQDPFRPLLPDVVHVPYGDLDAMRTAVAERSGRACVVLEPVLGEGGVRIPPPGYLRGVAAACREYDALFVVDEIQTGLGRLGSWWGVSTEDVVPDIMLVGKGLSGGVVPVAAAVCRPHVYAPFGRDPFLHSSTFGASPLACAAATAAIRAIEAEHVVARSAALGGQLLGEVRRACARWLPEHVAEVRGRGLLIGVEFASQAVVGEVALALMSRGVLVNHSLNAASVLRLTPPAVLDDSDLEFFRHVLDDALRAVADLC